MTEPPSAAKRPTLSLVIPTKDRYATLLPTLSAILSHINDPALEVIVHDNSADNTPALEFLDSLDDDRVVYVHLPQPVSIIENTEPALALARGDFVTFIGDDDLVAPDIVSVARSLSTAGVEAAIYKPAYWWWPSVVFSKPSRFNAPGAFWYPPAINGAARLIDSRAELARVLAEGAPAMFELPRLYHGLVARSALERLRNRTGRLVNGASPDMALATGLACVLDRHLLIDYPLTIYGASRDSGGGWTAARKHHGRIADQKHLPRSTIENWNPRLPPVWSEHTIYPQTVGEVMTAMGMPDSIDYAAFYASMLVNEPHLRSMLWPLAMGHLREHPKALGRFVGSLLKKAAGQTKRSFQRRFSEMPFHLRMFDSPDSCMHFLSTVSCDLRRIRDAP
ncbi:MAG: glycosyltransferase [Burkholderiaceae bacterium]